MKQLGGYLEYLKRKKSTFAAIILMAALTLYNFFSGNETAFFICLITTVVVAYRGYLNYQSGDDNENEEDNTHDQQW